VEQYKFVLQTKLDNQDTSLVNCLNAMKTKLGLVEKPIWVLEKTS